MIVGGTPVATVPIAGLYSPTAEELSALVIEVGGGVYTDYYELGTLRIRDRLDAASTAEFRMSPLVSLGIMPNVGERVRIKRQGEVIFDGSLQQMEVTEPFTGVDSSHDKNFLKLQAIDWTELADRHVIAKNYEVTDRSGSWQGHHSIYECVENLFGAGRTYRTLVVYRLLQEITVHF
jgi:hypothetical protein